MKYRIEHEIRGRIRIHVIQGLKTSVHAEILLYYLQNLEQVTSAKVYDRTSDVVILYTGKRESIIEQLRQFRYKDINVPTEILDNPGRELNQNYQEKLVGKVICHYARKFFLPYSFRLCYTTIQAIRYIMKGVDCLLKKKVEVPVLDATAITVSMLRSDISTASSIMFLLGVGELLEEWTHKKSVDDLARTMSLNVSKVWLLKDDQQVLVPVSEVKAEDYVVIHMGNVIPFDGVVTSGIGMVNQVSLTGESVPAKKEIDSLVYAGTIVEEGELTILVKKNHGSSRYEKIVSMIEQSEKMKSQMEGRAEHIADGLVPYTLGGTLLTYLFTKNITKALSILMVDFSCALKLAMPISVLSAIREAGVYNVTVKGGKYLESVANADTIVFDKTGTLTKATPTVKKVISFSSMSEDELLKIAACMEEHFPHSMATAVVEEAKRRGIKHDEMHSKVEYIVAHGIATMIEKKRTIIGSAHFVFEDEQCIVLPENQNEFNLLSSDFSNLYLAIEGKLAGVICIEDPLRKEAVDVIHDLKKTGISKVVMMTGDSEHTAKRIAKIVGVDEFYAEVLPEDKAKFVEEEKAAGRTVIMIGDGINDSPALSAANVGIAINNGAEIAREVADITIGADDLYKIVILKKLSNGLMQRINNNYHIIVGFNASLILLGVLGVIKPTTSALLHNSSTLLIGMKSMKNILED